MPSTRYRYYTIVMANALMADGESIPDSSDERGRPDQYLRNLLSAYGYEKDTAVSFNSLLNELERDGLIAFKKDLIAKGYWARFIQGIAPREAVGSYTWGDPLLPLLDLPAAFKRAVDLYFDAGEVVAGGDIRDLRYLLEGKSLGKIVEWVAEREPAVANGLVRSIGPLEASFDQHPLAAQFLLARLFELTEQHLGCWLLDRPKEERSRIAGPTRDGERHLELLERFLEEREGVKKRRVSVERVQAEIDALNASFGQHIKRLRLRAPGHLSLDRPGTFFRPQHVRPELTRDGNPFKVMMQRLRQSADPAMLAAVERLAGDLHRDPSFSLALALALPGAALVLGMLNQALILRRNGEGDAWRFPSGRTLLAWLYGSKTKKGIPPSRVPVGLTNFAERDRLELACPSVLADQAREDLESWLGTKKDLSPLEGDLADVVEAHTQAFMAVMPVAAPRRDAARSLTATEAVCDAAEEFWAVATYPHLVRVARSRSRERPGLLPAVGGSPVPWAKVFGRRDAADAGLEDGPRYASLDFTEVWPSDGKPLAPTLHPFALVLENAFDEVPAAGAVDRTLEDKSARLEQWRSEVFPKTTDLLYRALEAWAERVRLQSQLHVADARTRLFFVDGGKAGERIGFGPGSVAFPETDPETWASDGLPPFALVERFLLTDEYDRAGCEEVLDALQAFVEVTREVETALQREWRIAMKEMTG